jgi:hypothetical protein
MDGSPAPPPSPALLAAVARMRPVPARRPWREVAWITGCSVAAGAALIVAFGVAPGAPARVEVVLPIVLLFAGRVVAATVPPSGSVLPRPRLPLTTTAIATVAIVVAMLVADPHAVWPPPRQPGFAHAAWPCMTRGLSLAVVPVVIAVFVSPCRLHQRWRTLSEIAGAGSALAGLGLLFVCGSRDVAHVIIVHGGLLFVAPALALFVAVSLMRRLRR